MITRALRWFLGVQPDETLLGWLDRVTLTADTPPKVPPIRYELTLSETDAWFDERHPESMGATRLIIRARVRKRDPSGLRTVELISAGGHVIAVYGPSTEIERGCNPDTR